MRSGRLALLAAAAALAAGCQEQDVAAPSACMGEPREIRAALEDAPGEVALQDGTSLSACVRQARSDADLQNVGVSLTEVAEDLEAEALGGDEAAALQLGYLVGAARRGGARSSGLAAELVRRLERSAALDSRTAPGAMEALERGLRAGEVRG